MPHRQDDFVTAQMCEGLRRLQTVALCDFGTAYWLAYGGGNAIDPLRNETAAAWFKGRGLALDLWCRRQTATLDLREAARA